MPEISHLPLCKSEIADLILETEPVYSVRLLQFLLCIHDGDIEESCGIHISFRQLGQFCHGSSPRHVMSPAMTSISPE